MLKYNNYVSVTSHAEDAQLKAIIAQSTVIIFKMFSFTRGGVAVSFALFMFRSCVATVEEYTPLYMEQLGYSLIHIGLVPVLGFVTQTIGIPLAGFLADKFRKRKLMLVISTLVLIPNTMSFLVLQSAEISCEISTRNSSFVNASFLASSGYNISNKMLLSRNNESASVSVRRQDFHMVKRNDNHNERLKLFLIMVLLRGIFELFKRLSVTLITVSAMTHLKDDKTKYGLYACWGAVGSGISLFLVGILVGQIRHMLCGELVPSYYVTFLYAAAIQCMTLIPLPWLKYEYLEERVVNYAEVKQVIFNPHYMFMLVVCAHSGLCSAFQTRWEFWYIMRLGGTPFVMAVGGLIRRPIAAVWYLLSRSIISRLGELYVIALSLFIFSASFAALAFIENPWYVIVTDSFQSASLVLVFASFVIHFSKAGSEASSASFQGAVNLTFHGIGKEIGTAFTGWLFSEFGTKITLCGYSIVTMMFFIIFTVYIVTAKDLEGYMSLPSRDAEIDDEE